MMLLKMRKNQGMWVHWMKKGHKCFGIFVYILGKVHILLAFMIHDVREHYSKISLLMVVFLANLSTRFIIELFLLHFVSY